MRAVLLPALLAAPATAAVGLNASGGSYDERMGLAMADFAKAAYCLPYTGGNMVWDCIECRKYPGVTVTPFGIGTAVGTACYGYVAWDAKNDHIVVAFAGSSDARQWLADFECVGEPPATPGMKGVVWSGMYNAYVKQSPKILAAVAALAKAHPSASVLITGHSLGATQSFYAAADLAKYNPTVYAFAPARPGDAAWAESFLALVPAERAIRVTHYRDPVPHAPPSMGTPTCDKFDQRHAGTEVHYNLGVQAGKFTVCTPGVEPASRSSRCGADQYTEDIANPVTAGFWTYHLCYPGQCGVAAMGLPCVASPPFCLSPYTAMGNCLTGSL